MWSFRGLVGSSNGYGIWVYREAKSSDRKFNLLEFIELCQQKHVTKHLIRKKGERKKTSFDDCL